MELNQRLERFLGRAPVIDSALFIAPNATVLGDVFLAPLTSVWYGAVLRADINRIRIEEGCNLQDGTVVHLSDDTGVEVGPYTTVGHRAILHACRIGAGCLVGMGAVVLDGAEIGDGSLIGANTLVTAHFQCPPRSLVLGSPGKVVRALSEEDSGSLRNYALKYIEVARAHAAAHGRGPINDCPEGP